MKSLTANFFPLILACALFQSCRIQPQASGRAALPSPAQAHSLEAFVRQTYTEPNEALCEVSSGQKYCQDINPHEAKRFRALGPVRYIHEFKPRPDRESCTRYIALFDGTYCYGGQPGEPFQMRRVDAFSNPEAKAADEVLQQALGTRYGELRPLLFLEEYIEAPRIRCASFSVFQVLIPLKDANPKSIDAALLRRTSGLTPELLKEAVRDSAAAESDGLILLGLACLHDGKPFAVMDEFKFIPTWTHEVWDVFTHNKQDYLLVQEFGEDVARFEIFAISAVAESKESKGKSILIDLSCPPCGREEEGTQQGRYLVGLDLIGVAPDSKVAKTTVDAETHNYWGVVHWSLSEFDEAIADFTKALEINPRLAPAYSNRGEAYRRKGQYDQAIADHTKALEINPRFAEAYYNRGNAYASRGQYDQAIVDYTKALEINPRLAEAYYKRGNVYGRKDQHDKATADYTKALEIYPSFALAYENRAVGYYYLKDYDRAWEDVHKAQELGIEIEDRFLKNLREASGREK